jgi:Calcineurin-like phosphoesterase
MRLTRLIATGTTSVLALGVVAAVVLTTAPAPPAEATAVPGSTGLATASSAFTETWPGTNGAAWPVAWTTSSGNGTADTQGGAGRLAYHDVANAYARAQLTGLASQTDSELLVSYKWSSTTAGEYLSFFLRGSGGWQNAYRPRTGYGIQLASNSASVTVQKNVNGTTRNLHSVSGAQTVTTAKQWLRLGVFGSTIEFRTWLDGQSEPGAWKSVDTDTSVTAAGQLFVSLARSGGNTGGAKSVALDELQISSAATPAKGDPVLGVAGDIACATGQLVTAKQCQQAATASLLSGNDVTIVQTLGDEQYENGTSADFAGSYDLTWGKLRYKTDPAPGNHEYNTPGATGYYGYFQAAAVDPAKGYYSYDLGAWHIVVLNGEVANGAGSAQDVWFRNDLGTHHNSCTIALWHEPYFSSSGETPGRRTLFQDAYNGGVDIVLNGHEHNYERFAPQNPSGGPDSTRGVREFVVGTGGRSLWGFSTVLPTSQARSGNTFGVLKLALHTSSYDWRFVPIAGSTFTDSGTGTCH